MILKSLKPKWCFHLILKGGGRGTCEEFSFFITGGLVYRPIKYEIAWISLSAACFRNGVWASHAQSFYSHLHNPSSHTEFLHPWLALSYQKPSRSHVTKYSNLQQRRYPRFDDASAACATCTDPQVSWDDFWYDLATYAMRKACV